MESRQKRNWESEDYDGQKTENRESMKIEENKKWEKTLNMKLKYETDRKKRNEKIRKTTKLIPYDLQG